MEQIDSYIGRLFEYLRNNPQIGLLVAMALVLVYLIGLVWDWKWTLLPSGNSNFTQMWINLFGEKTVRIVKGLLAILLLSALAYLFWHYR